MVRLAAALMIIMSFYSLRADEGGYTNRQSYTQGDSISFFISTKKVTYNLAIYRLPDTINTAAQFNNLPGGERTLGDSSYYYGCNWPLSLKISSSNMIPGVYRAQFNTSRGIFNVVFFIKSANPGSVSKILVVPSTNTWQAYNAFGGKSLYDFNSTDTTRSYKVSFLRPSVLTRGYAEFVRNEALIIRWLNKKNIPVEYAVDYDLHSNQSLLSNYKIVIIAGHSEYWSYQERYQLQRFVDTGGKLIIMSGNTCWFQVRFENNGNTLVCYKNNADPLFGIADSLVTNNWSLPPINNPENKLIGVGFLAGGYVNGHGELPASEGYGDYAALNTWHWIYNNTGLHEGDEYGYNQSIVGNETDGALYTWQNGSMILTGEDGSPTNYRVLGISPAASDYPFTSTPHAMMGIYFNNSGGAVFNFATINWENGLAENYEVEKITSNVLNKFISNTFPPEINSWSPSNISVHNINNENVQLNDRNFFSTSAQDYNLKVSASPGTGTSMNFVWESDGVQLGTDSTLTYSFAGINSPKKATEVKCYVFNSTDTASISWLFFNTPLAFYPSPIRDLTLGECNIKLPVFNLNNLPLQFTYSGPSWLSVQNGVLTGVVPDTVSNVEFTIVVSSQNNADTLHYLHSITNSEEHPKIPTRYTLYQNFPNPFNPSTTIMYSLAAPTDVSLKVYDILGREVKVLVNSFQNAGTYEIHWDASALSSGVYFYRLTAGSFNFTRKLILQK